MNFRFRLLILLFCPFAIFAEEQPIRVALFDSEGVGPSSAQLMEFYPKAKDSKFTISRIKREQIQVGKLTNVDVLVHPGGSGGKAVKD